MKVSHLNPDGTPKYTNRLATETSPYLLQHAHNPVEWYPWGDEALARARTEKKPIHLSVGYHACHWCHVAAHESFEDEATARLLNDNFINIKVDREERPDIDRIYQIAQQMLTQRGGGWPLTMFLTHDDQRPFFGGTYFPKEARYGLPAFRDVLLRVVKYYRDHAAELRSQNDALMSAFAQLNPPPAAADTELGDAPLRSCRAQLARAFDSRHGGFGGAPKFPHPLTIERLLRDWHASVAAPEPDLQALHMATLTLRRMAEGGTNDQLGGGFCYSSLDADSEGHEGKFYAWDRAEVEGHLSAKEFAVFAPRFGLERPANFEGRWHLHVAAAVDEIAARIGGSSEAVEALLASARARLLEVRARRVRPARDEKVLTSWNALMIRGLAIAARALGRDELGESAGRALDFIRGTLWRDGRLLATSMAGRAHLNAYLDDYVYLVDAVLELQQLRFASGELEFARQLLEAVLQHFPDREAGGFFFTSADHEALIHRSKVFGDDATPSGNGIAARVLLRMGHLLGEPRYLTAAEQTLRAAWPALVQHPQAHVALLNALEELLHPAEIVILRGAAPAIEGWRRELARLYAPRRLVLAIPADAPDLPPALADKTAHAAAVAYVCRGGSCAAPVESLEALTEQLRAGDRR
ncbi:MAG: thioredoxin domain-containing protein [Gammaproteobacteria bacterium]|nr:MAG: thioredoxin domain-containing protein [Gammaproteobacteria bacterium]